MNEIAALGSRNSINLLKTITNALPKSDKNITIFTNIWFMSTFCWSVISCTRHVSALGQVQNAAHKRNAFGTKMRNSNLSIFYIRFVPCIAIVIFSMNVITSFSPIPVVSSESLNGFFYIPFYFIFAS